MPDHQLEAFHSPYGPLGYIVEGQPRYHRTVARDHTLSAEWSVDRIVSLPRVDVIHAYGELDEAVVETIASQARGIVYVGTGNGSIARRIAAVLARAARQGGSAGVLLSLLKAPAYLRETGAAPRRPARSMALAIEPSAWAWLMKRRRKGMPACRPLGIPAANVSMPQ